MITFPQGVLQQTVTVPIIDDVIFEMLEEFSAQLTASDRRITIIEPVAAAEIVDNDNGKLSYFDIKVVEMYTFHFQNYLFL